MTDFSKIIDRRTGIAIVTLFLSFRLLLLFVFNKMTGGLELASDVVFHEMIISDPLAILRGGAKEIASYPPFQWLVTWPLYNFYENHFSQMISYRLLMITVETLSIVTLIYVLNSVRMNRGIAITVLLLFLISPHQLFASEFFVQEDVISQLFVLLALYFSVNNKHHLSILVLSSGVLIAKIFLVIPLFYVVMFYRKQTMLQRMVVGCLAVLPIIIVYYFSVTNALTNGGSVPIRDFTPDAVYASNYWVLLLSVYPYALEQVKNASLLLTLMCQCTLLAFAIYYYRKSDEQIHPAILLSIPVALFFATFYQHMPEYLLLLWPTITLLFRTKRSQILLAATISFAWLPRVIHGLKNVGIVDGTAADARIELLGTTLQKLALKGDSIHQSALVAQSIVYTVLLIFLLVTTTKILSRKKPI